MLPPAAAAACCCRRLLLPPPPLSSPSRGPPPSHTLRAQFTPISQIEEIVKDESVDVIGKGGGGLVARAIVRRRAGWAGWGLGAWGRGRVCEWTAAQPPTPHHTHAHLHPQHTPAGVVESVMDWSTVIIRRTSAETTVRAVGGWVVAGGWACCANCGALHPPSPCPPPHTLTPAVGGAAAEALHLHARRLTHTHTATHTPHPPTHPLMCCCRGAQSTSATTRAPRSS